MFVPTLVTLLVLSLPTPTLWTLANSPYAGPGTEGRFALVHIVDGTKAAKLLRADAVSVSAFDAIADARLAPPVAHKIGYTSELDRKIQDILDNVSSLSRARSMAGLWPRTDDSDTVLNFAIISANSYLMRQLDWKNLTDYRDIDNFGWDDGGLRGHVFANSDASIIIVAFKGTSTVFTGGDTAAMDKYMPHVKQDNIMFSCCCARVDISWTPVCGCYLGGNKCNQTCLAETCSEPESYYDQGSAIVRLLQQKYQKAQFWFTGHSLGGAVAALMAVAFPRTAAITFESPGAVLYGSRRGLHPYPRNMVNNDADGDHNVGQYPVWNFGLSSDPIYMGTCVGLATTCYLSGYAIETKCRHGLDCLFNLTMWRNDVGTHRIDWVIDNILSDPERYPLPICQRQMDCTECQRWVFRSFDEKLPPLPIHH